MKIKLIAFSPQLIIQLLLGLLTISLIAILYPILEIQREILTENVYDFPVLFIYFPLIYGSIIILLLISIVFRLNWSNSEINSGITLLIKTISILLAWNYIFYDYNFYFNHWHSFDRLLILILSLLTLRFPLLLFPLLMQVNLLHHQFNFPIGGSSFLDKTLPYNLLIVSATCCFLLFILQAINRFTKMKIQVASDQLLLYLLLITLAAPYYHSGLEKALISPNLYEWFVENDLTNNIKAMNHRGWLQQIPWLHRVIVGIYSWLQIPGQFFILFGELAFLFILFSQKRTFWLILSMIILHVGVFIMNGALFWMWIVADIGMLFLLKKTNFNLSWKTGIIGIICIHFSSEILQVRALGWYDSPLDNRYELVADGEIISEVSMAPYTMHFQFGNMLPLLDQKMINAGFLIFNFEQYSTLRNLKPDELKDYLEKEGTSRYNPEIEHNMRRFLKAFLENDRQNPFSWLQPPSYWNAHILSTKKVVSGLEVDTLQLFHQFEWNREIESKLLKKRLILTVSD